MNVTILASTCGTFFCPMWQIYCIVSIVQKRELTQETDESVALMMGDSSFGTYFLDIKNCQGLWACAVCFTMLTELSHCKHLLGNRSDTWLCVRLIGGASMLKCYLLSEEPQRTASSRHTLCVLCVRLRMTPHSTLSAISGRKQHLWGGSFCQRSDHVDWFWLGHVRSISVREWENMLGWMEGCGVIYTSGPWSACNGSSEMTGFPMQAWERKCWTVDGGSICSSRSPLTLVWSYQKLSTPVRILKYYLKATWNRNGFCLMF